MIEIDSAPAEDISDETFAAVMDDISRRRRRIRLSLLLPFLCIVGAIALGPSNLSHVAAGLLALLAIPSALVGYWIDASRRNSVVVYDLDTELAERYADMCEAFDELCTCSKAWHIGSAGKITDLHTSKRHAGAQALIDLKPTILRYRQPKSFKSNITPPALQVGRQTLFLFPDLVVLEDGRRCGGAQYSQVEIKAGPVNNIEAETVPSDAVVVGRTWKYPNKHGGPDRRFRDNAQLPVCRYETLAFSSETGLSEVLQFSRVGPAADLAQRLTMLRI